VWAAAARWLGEDVAGQRTLLLSALVLMGLGNVLRVAEGDRRLHWWVAAALALYAAVMYLPEFGTYHDVPLSAAHFFELTPLGVGQWGLVVAVAGPALALSYFAGELARHVASKLNASQRPAPLR
jgi:hypothetical protein